MTCYILPAIDHRKNIQHGLVDLTRAVCSSIEEQFAAHSIDVRFDFPDQAIAEIDPNMLRRCC